MVDSLLMSTRGLPVQAPALPALPALVGREPESGVLKEALHEARHGHGRAVFLIGEDGVGKSRLALEAAGWGRRTDMRVLSGRTSRTGPRVPLRPLVEALADLFRDGLGLTDQSIGPYRAVLGRLVPEYGSGGAAPVASPVLLGEAVLRLLCVAGAKRGCLLTVEDLHDADAQTLAVVEYLADNIAGQAAVLLVTVRHEPGEAWDLAHALARRGSGTLLRLDRLGRDEVRQLAASYLDIAAEELPEAALDRIWRDSSGNPFVAEELLRAMVGVGALVTGAQGCRLVDGVVLEVPATVARSIAERARRLGPAGYRLLSAAAVVGGRFPIPVLQRVLRIDELNLLGHLRAAVAAGLLTTDETADGWYAFRDPPAAAALLSQLTTADRAALARRAAEAVRDLHPGLPGQWCTFAAVLTRSAGDVPGSARLFTEAGRRALAAGLTRVAAAALEQAWELVKDSDDARLRGDVLDELLPALAESGQADRGLRLADALEQLCGPGVDGARRAALHVRLAWLACLAGRWTDGTAQVNAALAALGPDAAEQDTAPVDAVAAHLALHTPQRAQQLAARAVEKAERSGLPVVACQAWQAHGVLALQRGTDEVPVCSERMRALARRHHLPLGRVRAMLLLGEHEWLAGGDTAALAQARAHAWRLGATAVRHAADTRLAMDHVLRGEYAEAARLADAASAEAGRLGLSGSVRHLSAIRAACAAHQGQRHELERIGPESHPDGGERSRPSSLALGLAGAVCALLEEDRDRARRALAEAADQDARRPAPYPLVGQHGLGLLLDVLGGHADWSRYREVTAAAASRLRWNHQFALLAKAVLLGRRGSAEAAAAAVTSAQQLAQPYPMAARLGLRLVAEAAHRDRWGDPVSWLRLAEEHFHQSAPPVATACRALLRRIGVVVPHRRGAGRIPGSLRMLGVTEREYEVLQLLADRPDNRSIASHLFISPRTVEKHVASLITKTEQPNRAALNAYAARVQQEGR